MRTLTYFLLTLSDNIIQKDPESRLVSKLIDMKGFPGIKGNISTQRKLFLKRRLRRIWYQTRSLADKTILNIKMWREELYFITYYYIILIYQIEFSELSGKCLL